MPNLILVLLLLASQYPYPMGLICLVVPSIISLCESHVLVTILSGYFLNWTSAVKSCGDERVNIKLFS